MVLPRRQRGIALITALIITAIAVVLASAMLWQVHLSQRRSANILFADQAYQYLRGAEDWATWILRRDAEQNKFDALNEAWATPLTGLAIEGGQLSGQLTDLQGKFNLNNLAAGLAYRKQFGRLLDALQITAPIEGAIVDWVDADSQQVDINGAEDGYYLRQKPAYRTANTLFESVSELRLVKGITPEIYAALTPHVTALPIGNTPINVNTATAPVLYSLFPNPGEVDIQRILEMRQEQPFESINAFKQHAMGPSTTPIAVNIGVNSNFFLLHTRANIGSLGITMY
ncbi:MAG TPA: type II secretion system minor pseudopilin GspK, partial [Gammaproteobacteria bacterium]|nr:type II secretion system minor pseudopilin GspK [Gammaproteobacteria bacterium]